MSAIDLAERGWLPDAAIRLGIRRMLAERLRQLRHADFAAELGAKSHFVRAIEQGPIALATDAANAQHYEVPAEFFRLTLGPHLKYSCGLHAEPGSGLEESERRMLALTEERAGVEDGMRVLDLGCGWGSLSLWLARRHPNSRITAVSNSKDQREFILGRAAERGIANLEGRYLFTVDVQCLFVVRHLVFVTAMGAVVLEQRGESFVVRQVVDGDHFKLVRPRHHVAEHQTADAAKSVNRDTCSHSRSPCVRGRQNAHLPVPTGGPFHPT